MTKQVQIIKHLGLLNLLMSCLMLLCSSTSAVAVVMSSFIHHRLLPLLLCSCASALVVVMSITCARRFPIAQQQRKSFSISFQCSKTIQKFCSLPALLNQIFKFIFLASNLNKRYISNIYLHTAKIWLRFHHLVLGKR